MIIHGNYMFFTAIGLNDFQRHVENLNSNEIIDLIISADLLMGK